MSPVVPARGGVTRVVVVLSATRLGRRVRRAVLHTPEVVVVADVPGDSGGVAEVLEVVTDAGSTVVVTDAATALPSAATVRARLRQAGVSVVGVLSHPTRPAVLSWVRQGFRHIVSDTDLDDPRVLSLTIDSARRGHAFLAPGAADAVLPEDPDESPEPAVVPSAETVAAQLTRQQTAVLRAIATGASTEKVAAELGMATATVRTHLHAILRVLGVENRAAAIAWAYRSRFVSPPT